MYYFITVIIIEKITIDIEYIALFGVFLPDIDVIKRGHWKLSYGWAALLILNHFRAELYGALAANINRMAVIGTLIRTWQQLDYRTKPVIEDLVMQAARQSAAVV